MEKPIPEAERLMLVQGLIDRLLYLEGEQRSEFLSYLEAMYCVFQVPRQIKYGREALINNCENQ
jgi:hypothetical protein